MPSLFKLTPSCFGSIDYSNQGGACRLPNGTKTSTWYRVNASGVKGVKDWSTSLRDLDQCKLLCTENFECMGFHRYFSGEHEGKCTFYTEVVKGNGEDSSTVECYTKNGDEKKIELTNPTA